VWLSFTFFPTTSTKGNEIPVVIAVASEAVGSYNFNVVVLNNLR
jgi:hypothetical protein